MVTFLFRELKFVNLYIKVCVSKVKWLCAHSQGFFVDGEVYPGRLLYFSPVDLDKQLVPTGLTGRQYMENMVDVALAQYNEMKVYDYIIS